MTRYRLDDLGWYDFEKLIQALLKHALDLRIESWGGPGDHGRDSYHPGHLTLPSKEQLAAPVVFQVKFVVKASVSGTGSAVYALNAVKREMRVIEQRIQSNMWKHPASYFFITNAQLDGTSRERIVGSVNHTLPDAECTVWGGDDVCDMLDAHPELRKSFPEILSIRDLETLLREVINQGIIERSRLAIEEAREVAPVFVHTRAYASAMRALSKYGFVVLDGPPEMGKTVIARMISLVKISEGWAGIDCRTPDDIFDALDRNEKQIFIADDAFGRTEYDPSLGRMWERDLGKVLRIRGADHWIVWTTRKHILQRALREIDVSANAQDFPSPSEIIVSAESLSLEEKARMLYKHAKVAGLAHQQKAVVRENARSIVESPHFTPERIRRFVRETLGLLPADAPSPLLRQKVVEEIQNPTKSVMLAYRRLTTEQRWLLISLLELEGGSVDAPALIKQNERHAPKLSGSNVLDAANELTGSFITVRGSRLEWTHPSYRDLVIEELAGEPRDTIKFLKETNLAGLKIAVSESGGVGGTRRYPLIQDVETQKAFQTRIMALLHQEPRSFASIMTILTSALRGDEIRADHEELIKNLLVTCMEMAPGRIASESRWNANDIIVSVVKAVELLDAGPLKWGILSTLWLEVTDELKNEFSYCIRSDSDWRRSEEPDLHDVELFLLLANLILEKRVDVEDADFMKRIGTLLDSLVDFLYGKASIDVDEDDHYSNQENWEDLGGWHTLIIPYEESSVGSIIALKEVSNALGDTLSRLDDFRHAREGDYDEPSGWSAPSGAFHIESMFEDL